MSMKTSMPSIPIIGIAIRSALAGIIFGVANSFINSSSNPVLQVAGYLLGSIVGWCLAGFLSGYFTHRLWQGATAGVITEVTAVASYYGTEVLRGVYGEDGVVQWSWVAGDLKYWLTLGLGAGPVFGTLGALGRRKTPLGAIALSVVPVYVLGSEQESIHSLVYEQTINGGPTASYTNAVVIKLLAATAFACYAIYLLVRRTVQTINTSRQQVE